MTAAVAPSRPSAHPAEPSLVELASPIDGIRLWLADLDGPAPPEAGSWLSATEQARAARFVFARDARRYRAAHGLLRRLLWQHFRLPARAEFEVGAHGKPRLAAAGAGAFSLSHSGERALIGIGGDGEIGVDIELLRRVDDAWPLAEQHFTAGECEALRRASPLDVHRAFLSGWTRKEACLKAVGSGLSISPSSFETGLAPQRSLLRLDAEDAAFAVSVHAVEVGAGMLAALATASRHPQGGPSAR